MRNIKTPLRSLAALAFLCLCAAPAFAQTHVTESSPPMLTLDLANTANDRLTPTATFALLDQTGRIVGRCVLPKKKLMPSEHAEASCAGPAAPPPGKFIVVSSVTYRTASGTGTTATYQAEEKQVVKEITFAVP